MSLLDKAKKAAEQAATKAKEGVEDVQQKRELGQAYGELGKITFTFELSPKSQWNGGFYPGAGVIDRVFQANLKPMLYMIDLADDPYRVLNGVTRAAGKHGGFGLAQARQVNIAIRFVDAAN